MWNTRSNLIAEMPPSMRDAHDQHGSRLPTGRYSAGSGAGQGACRQSEVDSDADLVVVRRKRSPPGGAETPGHVNRHSGASLWRTDRLDPVAVCGTFGRGNRQNSVSTENGEEFPRRVLSLLPCGCHCRTGWAIGPAPERPPSPVNSRQVDAVSILSLG